MSSEDTSFIEKSLQTAPEIAVLKTRDMSGHDFHQRVVFSELSRLVDTFHGGYRDERWIVALGMRGVGKSTLIFQTYRRLTEGLGVAHKDILCFSMSDAISRAGRTLVDIIASFEAWRGAALGSDGTPVYLLIDEVHHDAKWAETVKELYERAPHVFLLMTGSPSLALQNDGPLEADKARRINWLHVTPLRYVEYLMLSEDADFRELSEPVTDALFRSASATQVQERLEAIRDSLLSFRLRCGDMKVRKYLKQGGFPFTLNLPTPLAFDKLIRITSSVIEKDVLMLRGIRFDRETLARFPRLMTLLATWGEDVSLVKLAEAMQLANQRETLNQMMEALRLCEMIKSVKTHGGVRIKTTRPSRYAFGSTNLKAAFRWNIGEPVLTPDHFGQLLEDLVIQYFETGDPGHPISVYRREGDGEADFILETPVGDTIVCEVSYGRKNADQVRRTMADPQVKAKYGLVIADEPLSVSPDGQIVIVPKEYLLAC